MKSIYEYVLDAVSAGEKALLVTLVDRGSDILPMPGSKKFYSGGRVEGSLGVAWLDEAADDLARRALETGLFTKAKIPSPDHHIAECTLVAEPFFKPAELLILGGGNISRPLAQVAALLGYQVTVIDDRPEFSRPGQFPEARRVICDDFPKALENLHLGLWASAVVVTRGHQHDFTCLERLIRHDLAYLGMIGSKRKVELAKEYLRARDVPEERIAGVYMPVGLDVGAQTPEEIAVSIAAELVKARRGGESRSLAEQANGANALSGCLKKGCYSTQDLELLKEIVNCARQEKAAVLATVIDTWGSSPRKAGAKMLILPDGGLIGTIGGGGIEEEVRQKALLLLKVGHSCVLKFSLNNEVAASQGMICGGVMQVFIEPLRVG